MRKVLRPAAAAALAGFALLAAGACAPSPVIVPVTYGDYSVFAWNDLGMHCLNSTYDTLVILPPYNTLVAQVVKRGSPPQLVTSGITIEYRVENNTRSVGKRSYGQFWSRSKALFGTLFGLAANLPDNVGLKGKGLSGVLAWNAGKQAYTAEGIPVVPVDDSNAWNPYQAAVLTVKDLSGSVLATTKAAIPASDEINCLKCHDSLGEIVSEHGRGISTPVLCASCHESAALGSSGPEDYLSKVIHQRHSGEGAQCYDCHPGAATKCSRSTRHTNASGNCTACHGTIGQVASSISGGRVPWVNEPKCVTCHGGGVPEVDTGATLYRNATGHKGMYCASCHGSPHAMIPTNRIGSFTNWDTYQAQQYQGYSGIVKTIGSCGVCHPTSRGWGTGGFAAAHGGPDPTQAMGCYACHTSVPSGTADIADWPHQFQWKDSNQ